MTRTPAPLPLSRRRAAARIAMLGAGVGLLLSMPVRAQADGARAFFENVTDGAVVSAPVQLKFGVTGKIIAPAGMEKQNSGHFVLLIDRPPFGEDPGRPNETRLPLPSDANHRRFAGGRSSTEIDLPPGEHTLQLVLADAYHTPHRPPVVSERITITVQ